MQPLLIIDFEATCWGDDLDGPPRLDGHRYASEIIEFGCALLNADGTAIERTWQQYVRPVFNHALSPFCEYLTGISQRTVDSALPFEMALHVFRNEFGLDYEPQPWFASWSDYDRNILMDDCHKHHADYPFHPDNHINLKTQAKHALTLPHPMGVSWALEAIGLDFEGRPHSGVDDAYNTARIALEMFKRGWRPRPP